MPNFDAPKPLDKTTLDRLSREWDARSGTGPFTLSAGANPETGEFEIRIIEGFAPEPTNPYSAALLLETLKHPDFVIPESEMASDLPQE